MGLVRWFFAVIAGLLALVVSWFGWMTLSFASDPHPGLLPGLVELAAAVPWLVCLLMFGFYIWKPRFGFKVFLVWLGIQLSLVVALNWPDLDWISVVTGIDGIVLAFAASMALTHWAYARQLKADAGSV